jgi:hypothetical protein
MKTFTIEEKIAHYLSTLAVWSASDDEFGSSTGPEFDAHVMAELAMVRHPCASPEEVKMKVGLFVSHEYFFETLQGNGRLLTEFVQSLVVGSGHEPQRADKVETHSTGHSLPQEAAAMGEAFQPHQNGEGG